MREIRTYGSVRGARDETRVPTATHTLFIGWYDYALATGKMPIEAQLHQVWYIALHPIKLAPQHSAEPYQEVFPALRTKSRGGQKRMLNQAIESRRTDADLMSVNGPSLPLNSSTRSGAPPRPHHRPAPGTSRGARRLRPPASDVLQGSAPASGTRRDRRGITGPTPAETRHIVEGQHMAVASGDEQVAVFA